MNKGMRAVFEKLLTNRGRGITRQNFPTGFALASRIADLRKYLNRAGAEIWIKTIHEPNSNNGGYHARYVIEEVIPA